MSTLDAVTAAAAALEAACKTVLDPIDQPAHLRVYADMGAAVDPPAAVVGPPTLRWEAGPSAPTSARFPVYVIAAADDRAQEQLLDLVPQVAEALDAVTDAVVLEANPGAFKAGATDLPSYQITTEVSLQ